MLNKKAIAAFAAGATLLAGFAMSTPAFAADAKADKCASLQKIVNDATTALREAEANVTLKQIAYDKDDASYKAAEKLVNAYKNALKAADEAAEAYGDAEGDEAKAKAEDTVKAKVKELNKALKALKDTTVAAYADLKGVAASLNDATEAAGVITFTGKKNSFNAKLKKLAPKDDDLKNAKKDRDEAKHKLGYANYDLQQAGCVATPKTPKTPVKPDKKNSKDKGKHNVHINTKGHKGKKQLSKTGVGVAFAALAAALLAGMGAAVRKIRH